VVWRPAVTEASVRDTANTHLAVNPPALFFLPQYRSWMPPMSSTRRATSTVSLCRLRLHLISNEWSSLSEGHPPPCSPHHYAVSPLCAEFPSLCSMRLMRAGSDLRTNCSPLSRAASQTLTSRETSSMLKVTSVPMLALRYKVGQRLHTVAFLPRFYHPVVYVAGVRTAAVFEEPDNNVGDHRRVQQQQQKQKQQQQQQQHEYQQY